MARLVDAAEADLGWSLTWTANASSEGPTVGVLIISVGGEDVWSSDDGDWPWIDLLRWLAKSWVWLKAEEGPPAPLDAAAKSVAGLEASLGLSAAHSTEASLSRASVALWDFRETHDLSRALDGASAPPIVIWREGWNAHILTEDGRYSTGWERVESALRDLGDLIAKRVQGAARPNPSEQQVVDSWRYRERKSTARWLAVARAQGQPNVVSLPDKWNDVQLGQIETSPLVAAARMTSNLSAPLADRILQLMHEMPRTDSSIASVASSVLQTADLSTSGLPFDEGYVLASAVREHSGLLSDEPFHPEMWLENVGVSIRDVRLGIRTVEALAAWGPNNGPGVLINIDGSASSSRSGRNASLAHEMCHLIIDRTSALPAAEVLGGRVDARIEQRARAFAAELLLPRAAAGDRFTNIGDEATARSAVNSLSRRFVVGREVVAWQTRNSEVPLAAEVYEYLRSLVRFPDRF